MNSRVLINQVCPLPIAILVLLFMVQRFGTDKVVYTFAPILCVWFLFISGIGIFNFIKHDPSVVKAVNPKYIIDYFKRNKKHAWISLGGVILTTTGSEALFADVGHFTVRSKQISMCTVIYRSIILAYTGQASYLRKHNDAALDAFYKSVPGTMYWPMFVVAILASIIASQSLISGAFSVVQQSLSLGCFPRVRVVHTSSKYEGQVYIPEINYLLMLACVFVTIGFRTTLKLSNAYGIAVVFVLTLTSAFLVLVMIMIWKTHIALIILYVVTIGLIELVYLSSVLYKFNQGGYLPVAFAFVLMLVMLIWNYAYRKKYYFELDHKISPDNVKEIMMEKNFYRLPGLAIFYSELVHGIPPIFKHYVANVLCYDFQVYRCVVRYGYTDVRNEQEPFEKLLVEQLKVFVREDYMGMTHALDRTEKVCDDGSLTNGENADNQIVKEEEITNRDIEVLDEAWKCGVAHFVGENEIVARKGSSICKRVIIDYAYNFLKRNLRQSNRVFDIPQERMLKVGMTYELK
ncbi:potassium transporter 5-like [Olea europaea subsp. europaea]|uniref:Potassium transporter 5-like n=1 Tax=Olea europaea subsp. europaea TaxID=158383 RepID=A0A8S0S5Y8_OLEEU|nr:potassium transporter 5-like [Olea europaea subsp. europaea]